MRNTSRAFALLGIALVLHNGNGNGHWYDVLLWISTVAAVLYIACYMVNQIMLFMAARQKVR